MMFTSSREQVRALLVVLIAMLDGCVGMPQKGGMIHEAERIDSGKIPTQRTAFSGAIEPLTDYMSVYPDCTSAGMPRVSITNRASHGVVLIRYDVKSYPNFDSANQRYECNLRKNPSATVWYRSEKTFVGTDNFSVKVVYSSGYVLAEEFVVSVERLPKDQAGSATQ